MSFLTSHNTPITVFSMTLSWWFMPFGFSFAQVLNTTAVQRLITLEPFGFTENSQYQFHIRSSIPTILRMFLIPEKQNDADSARLRYTCYSSRYPISYINGSDASPSVARQWNGTITDAGVYVPVFVDCLYSRINYQISVSYTNSNGCLDFRERNIPLVLFIFAIAHAVCGVTWIINILVHRRFCIVLQYFMAIIPLVKATLDSLSSHDWNQRNISDSVPVFWSRVIEVVRMMYYVWMFSIVSLAISGFCIFRSSYQQRELFTIMAASIVLSAGISWPTETNSVVLLSLSIIALTIGIFWFMRVNLIYLLAAVDILNSPITDQIESKVSLAKRFGKAFCVGFGITGVLRLFMVSVNAVLISQIVVYETALLAHEVLRMRFFLITKEHESEHGGHEKTVNVPRIGMITDPVSVNLVLLSSA